MSWSDWITLPIAVLGAGLGIYNALQSRRDRSVRVSLEPKQSIGIGADPNLNFVGFGITNHSAFPITIVEVGITIGKPKGSLPKRAMLLPKDIAHGELPMKIEARHGGSVTGFIGELPNEPYDHAYARTSGGEIVFGTSPGLLQVLSRVKRYSA